MSISALNELRHNCANHAQVIMSKADCIQLAHADPTKRAANEIIKHADAIMNLIDSHISAELVEIENIANNRGDGTGE